MSFNPCKDYMLGIHLVVDAFILTFPQKNLYLPPIMFSIAVLYIATACLRNLILSTDAVQERTSRRKTVGFFCLSCVYFFFLNRLVSINIIHIHFLPLFSLCGTAYYPFLLRGILHTASCGVTARPVTDHHISQLVLSCPME